MEYKEPGGSVPCSRLILALLALALLIHSVPVILSWGETYWDFGDGNYLYISRRLSEGITLYRDILAPQPPLHLVTGAALTRIGDAVFGPERWYFSFRAFSLLVRAATALLLFLLTSRALRSAAAGLLAAAIWLWLPIGYWWQLGYQSEPLELLFLLLAVLGVWRMTPLALALAGLASALAAHTNMTAAPYFACNAIFLLARRPPLALWYLAPALAFYFLIATITNAATDGYFWNNVIFNQTGTFPPPSELAAYLSRKLPGMMSIVFALEGGWLLLAAAGVIAFARGLAAAPAAEAQAAGEPADPLARIRGEYLIWTAIGHWLSIGFTAKGGTVDYIFTLGEPFLALFAAAGLMAFWRRWRPLAGLARARLGDTLPALPAIGFALLLFFALFNPLYYITSQLARELPARRVREISYLIEHYTRPGDPILTPPFYAVITHRRVAAEYSENFIWSIKYHNERRDRAEAEGVAKARELQAMLERKEIPLVLLDMPQTAKIPEIRQALDAYYHQIEPQPYETRNTSLTFWIPRDRPITHKPLPRQ